MATRIAYTQPQTSNQGFARTIKRLGNYKGQALLTTDEVTGNVVALFKAPKGFVVDSVYLSLTDIDTNGTPTTLVTLGDAGNAARFVASSNIGQAGGSTTTLAASGFYYEFTQDTDILLTFATGSATPAAGTVVCTMAGFMV